MSELFVDQGCDDDLERLIESHPADVGLIEALIEELAYDSDTLASLSSDAPTWKYLYNPPFEIKRFEACWADGRRIYSLKLYNEEGHLIDFRVLLGHCVDTDDYFVLAVQPRNTCYVTTTTAFGDLCSRYDGLNIPNAHRYK